MRWLIEAIVELVRRAVGGRGPERLWDVGPGADPQERLRAEYERMEASLRTVGGSRTIQRFRIGPPAEADGVSSEEQLIHYDDDPVSITLQDHESRRCSSGDLLGGQVVVSGVCSVCGGVCCTAPGCTARCERCGGLVCRRHSAQIAGTVYCTRHVALGYWIAFWRGLP